MGGVSGELQPGPDTHLGIAHQRVGAFVDGR